MIKTPCVQVCELDKDGLCSGCYRTMSEIGQWSMYSNEEREMIMQALPQRQEKYLANSFE